jgi:hypothetical protein
MLALKGLISRPCVFKVISRISELQPLIAFIAAGMLDGQIDV